MPARVRDLWEGRRRADAGDDVEYMDYTVKPRNGTKRSLGRGVYADPYPTYDQPPAGITGIGVDLEKRALAGTLPVRPDAPARSAIKLPVQLVPTYILPWNSGNNTVSTAFVQLQGDKGLQLLEKMEVSGMTAQTESTSSKPKRKRKPKAIAYPAPRHRTTPDTDTPLSELEETENWG